MGSHSSSQSPLIYTLLLTGVGLVLIALFEEYNPGGSALAWLLLLFIVLGHLPLFTRRLPALADKIHHLQWRFSPGRLTGVVLVILLFASLTLTWRQHQQIFTNPVDPMETAHIGLMLQASSRWAAGETPLYHHVYPRTEGGARNRFPTALKLPYLTARAWGLEWRFANLAATILFGGLLVFAATWMGLRGRSDQSRAALLALVIGVAWLLTDPVVGMMHWGYWAVMWPLVLALGLSLSAGWWVAVALLAGALAAMTPGWVLLLPVIGVILWRESPGRFPALLVMMLLLPLVSYGVSRAEGEAFFQGVLGSFFNEGAAQTKAGSWRYPTLHAWGDLLAMRHAFYLLALVLLVALGRETVRATTSRRRAELLAAASFVVIGFGPATYQYHWYAQCALLVGLLPLYICGGDEASDERPAPGSLNVPGMLGGATVAACVALCLVLTLNVRTALNQVPDGRQAHTQNLVSGFNIPSADHVWGRRPYMVTGFYLDRPVGGFLEIELESLQGDFIPYNPAVIRVNGFQKAYFMAPPGSRRVARLALSPADVHVGFNVVEIRANWARSPRSYNLHDDNRPLSLRYSGLSFRPAGHPGR